MATPCHALVWIDHQQAKIFHFDARDADQALVRSSHPHQHLHHKANSPDSGHAAIDKWFLRRVADALESAGAILISGPAGAKTELAAYLRQTRPEIAQRISGVQTADHPGTLVPLRYMRADSSLEVNSVAASRSLPPLLRQLRDGRVNAVFPIDGPTAEFEVTLNEQRMRGAPAGCGAA